MTYAGAGAAGAGPAALPTAEATVEIDPVTVAELMRMAPGQILVGEPMARHTSFGLGGPADLFIEPDCPRAFRDCAALLADRGVPVTTLGRGTNVLVRSGGIDGAVMTGASAFCELERDGESVRAGSGVGLSRLLAFCAENGLSGLEGLSGIPGSAGGAVATNAGSFGVSIGDLLVGVTISKRGTPAGFMSAEELHLRHRESSLPEGSFVEELTLSLSEADPDEIESRQRETLERKWKSQPSGMRSAGCVFSNPPGDAAGRLIDETGLKGTRVGGAVVSDLHANFILNDRGATPEDVEELIELVRERVEREHGVWLELEIEIIGRRLGGRPGRPPSGR